jgi:fibronectin type III domain protein
MKRSVRFPGLLVTAAVTVSFAVLVPSSLASAVSAPASPQGVHARSIAGFAYVTWSRPSSGAPIKSYVVTSHPLGRTCVSKTTTCAVTHLKAGASYAFTVVARTATGTSSSSPLSNKVRIPTAGKNYLSAVGSLNDAVATDFVAIDNAIEANPNVSLTKYLKQLSGAYSVFTYTLKADEWPSDARSAIASIITDENEVSTDSVDLYQGSAATAPAIAVAVQTADNAEIEADAQVRADLGLSQVITAPITTTPTPTAIGSPATVHDFTNDELSVTVSQIYDPATAANGSGLPDAGTRFVAVEMSLADVTGGSIAGDANYSTTVVGTDGKTYTADIGGVAECTNFTVGTFQIEGTDTTTSGCVVFELPTTVSVQTVDFSLAPGYLDSGVWNN